ncbi:hypothetical protein J2Z69_003784 [Paenibacillus shirakamiensis]|uniref:Uncharacterized protein n=1 Tax=Paenibacillus shirakamiensis TaxID=1265935 RepID=A0ABS4JLT6_9BACL|nr:hypothetical protein [Paenibacillus shirakamiensis]MBP2002677.1 hypothetical protein [Paenibacillus shirakamiensis]
MLGMLFNDKECKELDYVLRKELDEMLLDMGDTRLDHEIRQAISNRYKTVFRMYARFAPTKELSRYAPKGRFPQAKH